MASKDSSEAPIPRVRIAPSRGVVQLAALTFTAIVTLGLLLSYTMLVALVFVWIGIELHALTKTMAVMGMLHWDMILQWMLFFALGVTWIFMLRPLRPRVQSSGVSIQVTAATQPQLFQLFHLLCWHLKVPPPVEVWLDTTISIRTTMKGGLKGILTGQSVVHIGMPVISVVTARELGGLIARELGYSAGGLGMLFVHTVRELNVWFYRAAMERDPWEMDLKKPIKDEGGLRKALRSFSRAWMWLAKAPFLVIALIARAASSLALWMMERSADQTGANVIGISDLRRMQRKLSRLGAAWETASAEIRRGISQHRLPENLSLLMSRHVAKVMQDDASKKAREAGNHAAVDMHEQAGGSASTAPGEVLVQHLSASQPAAAVMRNFVDLSRQVTYFYYQHDLGLNIVEHRMIADEEVLHQNRREEQSLVVIRRYFGGLAHPERSLCGLGATPVTSPGRGELMKEILRVRQEITLWGPQHKAALQEWNIAWQRRRDLETAAVLSMAGFSVSRVQFGVEDSTPQVFRNEGARQRLVMEHMEGTITERERELESRFSCALGLLWWSVDEELAEEPELIERRKDLPGWVGVYEAMSGALTSFRELLTTFFAFQTLGAKFTNVDDPGALVAALQTVVPKMLNLVHQIVGTMDGAPYPFVAGGQPVSLNDHLIPRPMPQAPATTVGIASTDATSLSATALKMASEASENIAPYVDAFLGLYHRAFAWLCETAEMTERHFLGPMCLGGATEILLPDEFMSRKLGVRSAPSAEPPPAPATAQAHAMA